MPLKITMIKSEKGKHEQGQKLACEGAKGVPYGWSMEILIYRDHRK